MACVPGSRPTSAIVPLAVDGRSRNALSRPGRISAWSARSGAAIVTCVEIDKVELRSMLLRKTLREDRVYEHHPDRFEDACKLEEELCHRDELSWAQGYRLRDLIPRADAIKEKRAKAIVRPLRAGQQIKLFDDGEIQDDLAVTSCGLLCGK